MSGTLLVELDNQRIRVPLVHGPHRITNQTRDPLRNRRVPPLPNTDNGLSWKATLQHAQNAVLDDRTCLILLKRSNEISCNMIP